MRTGRFQKRLVVLAGLGLCLIPIAVAVSWRQITLRYHLYHLSHGPCRYRDSAFRFLLRWNGQDADESTRVDEVFILAQEDGGNMLAILEPHDDADDGDERQVWLFDKESALIYTGEMQSSGVKDLTGDGLVELAIKGHWTIEDDDRDFEVFLVLSANQIMRPLVIVCCDEGDDPWWSWRFLPKGSTDIHDVEIGKERRMGKEDFAPSVIYRWSPEVRAYVGPKGGGGEPYVRLESWDELWTFLGGREQP